MSVSEKHMSPPSAPTRPADRVEFVDALRGFALLGVFAANLFIFSGHVYMTDEQRAALPTAGADHVVHLLELVFVENKFMGLFSLLFGLWLFYGFTPGPGLMGGVGPAWLVPVWAAGGAVQVWFASLWLRRFRFGPAEWLWRSLTYWKIQTLRPAAGAAG